MRYEHHPLVLLPPRPVASCPVVRLVVPSTLPGPPAPFSCALHAPAIQRTEIASLRNEVSLIAEHLNAVDKKIDDKTGFLSRKIDHFTEYLSTQQTRDRNKFEEERHLRIELQRKMDERLEQMEQRLTRLESLVETPSPTQ